MKHSAFVNIVYRIRLTFYTGESSSTRLLFCSAAYPTPPHNEYDESLSLFSTKASSFMPHSKPQHNYMYKGLDRWHLTRQASYNTTKCITNHTGLPLWWVYTSKYQLSLLLSMTENHTSPSYNASPIYHNTWPHVAVSLKFPHKRYKTTHQSHVTEINHTKMPLFSALSL